MIVRKPRLLPTLSFLVELPIVVLMLYGIRTQIEDGSITNEPELLRQLMFYPFSLAICFRFCHLIGIAENSRLDQLLMFVLAYIPTTLILAKVAGMD